MFPDNPATWRGLVLSWDGSLASAVLVAIYPAWAYFTFRRLKAVIPANIRTAKLRVYCSVILSQWFLVAGVLWIAGHHGLSPADLGQSLGITRRTVLATVLLLVAVSALTVTNLRQIQRMPVEKLSAAVHRARIFLPEGMTESALFALMSVTAGVCEEILYRGWLVNVLGAATGSIWIGVVIGGALFGIAHAYQGPKGIPTTGILGLVFGVAFAWTRSLVPGQVLHAAIDLINGLLGARIVSRLPAVPAETG